MPIKQPGLKGQRSITCWKNWLAELFMEDTVASQLATSGWEAETSRFVSKKLIHVE